MNTKQLFSIALAGTFAIVISSCEDNMSNEMPNNLNTASSQLVPPPAKSTVGDYTFTGKESDPIALETAKAWAGNYRKKNPGEREGHFFGFEILNQILAQKGCMGIRAYYAIDEKGQKQLLLVGVDAKGENILPTSMKLNPGTKTQADAIVADASFPCPSMCADGTSL